MDAHRRTVTTVDQRAHFRGDIQGMRAVAVGLVLADHVFGRPSGGFVGVDVFFVISGFLITGLLLRELERTGRISFRDFYVRRVRRILPVAMVTLGVTVAAAYLLLGGFRAEQTLRDAGWAAAFAANVHFAAIGTDYFTAAAPPSPLQHFWSLSVEEQFYVVWPMLLLVATLAAARLTRRPKLTVGVVSTLVVAGSLLWSISETDASPTSAYFSTATRGWELGVGALLAIAAPRLATLPRAVLFVAAWAGAIGVVASAVLFTPGTPFPGSAAALPVLGTALVIAGGSRPVPGTPAALFLASPPFRYVGNISYSLYLWHWPLLVITSALVAVDSLPAEVAIAAGSLLLAVASYHLVEQPVARSGWLLREPEKLQRQSDPSQDRTAFAPRNAWAVGLTVLAVATTVGVFVGTPAPAPATVVAPVAPDVPAPAGTGTDPATPIEAALAATTWPQLDPSIDDVLAGPHAARDVGACAQPGKLDVAACTWGPADAPRTAVLIGDSTAVAYIPALQEAVSPDDGQWRLVSAAMNGCEFIDVPVPHNKDVDAACPGRKEDAVSLVAALKPDLVIVTHAYIGHDVGAGQRLPPDLWAQHLAGYLDRFAGNAGQVVLLAPPPQGKILAECYTRVSTPEACASTVGKTWTAMADAERVLAGQRGARFVDSTSWFCSAERRCPAFVGTTVTRFDSLHVTKEYSREIAPMVAESLAPAMAAT